MAEGQPLWRIELMGLLCATHLKSEQTLTRFRTHKTGALLAYLACFPDRPHPREVLIDLLWPEVGIETGRHNLSNALTALRRQLEPSGVAAGTVLTADRFTVTLHSNAAVTDVAVFEQALHDAALSSDAQEKRELLLRGMAAYGGTLLPGYYENWIMPEQQRLQAKFLTATRECIALLRQSGEPEQAIALARRAVGFDALDEAANRLLLELLHEAGQSAAVLRHYRAYIRTLEQETGSAPPPATQQFVQNLLLQKVPVPVSFPAAGSLPARLTRFFGRETEQARIAGMLTQPECRLLTLTGPGGVGKTRLALETADKIRAQFGGAVWFVPLAEVNAAENLTPVALAWMNAPPSPQHDTERLAALLSRQRSLLILDNFEHLVSGGALWVQSLLERVPTLACLITSRQRLQLSGETIFHVAPLPSSGGATTPETVLQNESVRLFVDRAQAVRPDFAVTTANAPAIAELCDRLEGLPLALELAAARAQTFTPEQMLAQMKQRFAFLVSSHRDRAGRHRTLHDTLEWSYRLLTPALQMFFARLSVFCGGWTWQAAETVCSGGGGRGSGIGHTGNEEQAAIQNPQSPIQNVPPPDTRTPTPSLDLLAQLCECSLLITEESGAEIRFRMLETVREFAQEQVDASSEPLLNRRHTACFLALAQEAEPKLKGQEQSDWLARLEREHDNFCAALLQCERSAAEEERRTGLEIAAALWRFWYVRGHLSEGRKWFRLLLPTLPVPAADALTAKALNGAGCLAWGQHDLPEARRLLEASLAMQRELGDAIRTASALNNLGLVARAQGDSDAAIRYHEDALGIQREREDWKEVALSLNNLAAAHAERGDDAAAHALYTESTALWRTLDDRWGLALSLSNLGAVLQRLRRHTEARFVLEEGLAIRRQLDDRSGIAMSLLGLGMIACEADDFAAASAYYAEALRLHRKMGNPRYLVQSLHAAGDLSLKQNELTNAAAHYAEALEIYRQMNMTDTLGVECLAKAALLAEAQGDAGAAECFAVAAAYFQAEPQRATAEADDSIRWRQALDAASAFCREAAAT